jgi:cyclic pyranopterin phosphate synthase
VYKAGGDVRLVLLGRCQSACNFCHEEGCSGKTEDPVSITQVMQIARIARFLGLSKIHLTGGEPTLHPVLGEILDFLNKEAFVVGITTNGEIPTKCFTGMLQHPLGGINFSVHALTAEQYLEMDLHAKEIEGKRGHNEALVYSQNRIDMKLGNIAEALLYARKIDPRFKVKVNTVVQNSDVAYDIVVWANSIGANPRMQCNLNTLEKSERLIEEVVKRLHAREVRKELAIGDSSGSGTLYEYTGGTFKVKHFGNIYIPSMCDECPKKGTSGCRERFYGVRISSRGVYTCIDRVVSGQTRWTLSEFEAQLRKNVGVPAEIREQYAHMRALTEK